MEQASRLQPSYLLVCATVALVSACIFTYSQTWALTWDEGFHLLAAQLIAHGRTPYVDFVFPQTPLNAYWNAAWMSILGETWRVPQALAALLTTGAIWLTADFAYFQIGGTSAGITSACFMGLNGAVFRFGTVGQAYGMCLFLMVLAFRLAVSSERTNSTWLAVGAGLAAGAAAASSLLTAPAGPILLLWILFCTRSWRKAIAFAAAETLVLSPLLWLYLKAPRQVLFNVLQYHLFYRQADWEGAIRHDLELLTSWIDSGQGLALGVFAIGGIWFVSFRRDWDLPKKREFYLCALLALGIGLHLANAHPTFEQYYMLMVPFLSLLATVALCEATRRIAPTKAYGAPMLLALFMSLALARTLYSKRNDYHWDDLEAVAHKVDSVTSPNAPLLSDEFVYFLTKRPPPSGMEHPNSHKLQLTSEASAALHVVPRADLVRRIEAGEFSTVETCEDQDSIEELGLDKLYSKSAHLADCSVFWK